MAGIFRWARIFSFGQVDKLFVVSCLFGVLLSIYSYVIEMHLEEDADYEAMCDISERISCTNVFSSEYARGFGIVGKFLGEDSALNQPNSVAGVIFFLLLLLIGQGRSVQSAQIQVGLTAVSNLMSMYLAYVLAFVLHDICVVCISTYIVNFVNLSLSLQKLRLIKMDLNRTHED